MSHPLPQVGQIVRVRQRQYLVEEVVPPPDGGCTLVRLACVDDDAQGQPLETLWEMEVDALVLDGSSWDAVAARGFDPPRVFSAYLHTLRWNCVTATDPKLFQSPFRAGIKLNAYQIEPLRKALLLPRVNLFIADDVGLGKTIEAGLVARELLLRKKVRDIVVTCPPSVLPQWHDELQTRFGLTFAVLDREYVARVRQERGYGVNPWRTHSRFLISHRLLIDEAYAGTLRDWLGAMRPGSLLILDEAHHAAPSSGQRYAIDSRITRSIRDLAPRFEHRLFLSATPHNGHSNSFSALLEILDPQRFCRGVPVRGKKVLADVMVRRLKEDIREVQGGFPRRVVRQVDLDGLPADTPELALARLLDDYRRMREERLSGESKRVRAVAGLLVCGLQQRLLSSVEAFARTLRVHRRTVERQERPADESQARFAFDLLGGGVGSDDDRAEVAEEELMREEEAQVEAATRAAWGTAAEKERELLKRMSDIAEAARDLPDARVRELERWLRENLCPALGKSGAAWNDTRVLIFTEYDDTQRYLRRRLEALVADSSRGAERIAVFNGPTPPARREEIKRAFNGDPAKYPLRILIATDAAREGINLQTHCHHLFHFDIPWNPSRMEQRNGRIDRKLQTSPEVCCHYFVYKQRPEDRILARLVQKTATIKAELGSLAQVVEGRLAGLMAGGIRLPEIDRLERAIDAAGLDAQRREAMTEELEQARQRQDELREQIDGLRDRLQKSREWIGLHEGHFRSAISVSLEMLGAEVLQPQTGSMGLSRFVFPALDRRDGADPTWADTIDTLRPPRPREQKPWEWRQQAAPRPVVFDDPGVMTDEVVHLHLEHRVVQRLLGRFLAQGFIHHDLSRSCLAVTSDSIRRVVLLGRLCLYGAGAARLHEELIAVSARWSEPRGRQPLTPYKRDAEEKTLALLEDALLPDRQRPVEPRVLEVLKEAGPLDVRELLPHLEKRGEEIASDALEKLKRRGNEEAGKMRQILQEQRDQIARTAARTQDQRDLFSDLPDERRQLEANQRHWGVRLKEIEAELEQEPRRIEAVYEVKARRIEPVGLVYLWPVTG